MRIQENLHMIIGTLLLGICVYFYTSAFIKDSVLVESFEGKIGPDTADYGSSDNSSLSARTSTDGKCGSNSVELRYSLKPYGYVYFAKGYGLYHRTDSSTWVAGVAGWMVAPDKIAWEDFNAFSISLKGRGVGKVALDLKDSGGELWRKTVHLNSKWWKTFTVPLDDFAVRRDWQPDHAVRNGYIDYPFQSFQIEPKKLGSGTLYADCVKFVHL